jgi:uncharacterized membrane protein YphA (DoxX/SURF4 family)
MKKIAWGDLALWVPALFLAWIFARQGVAKFSESSGWARAFAVWHFPGLVPHAGRCRGDRAAVLLLTRRTAPIGAALIVLVMLGAMGTHLYWDVPAR